MTVESLAVLSIGSNLGDRLGYLRAAVRELAKLDIRQLRTSAVYETAALEIGEQPPFLNAVVSGNTTIGALALLREALRIESFLGRTRISGAPKTSRVIDIDLIAYGCDSCDSTELRLPHPRAHLRRFVLEPWLELDPAATLGARGPIAELLAVLPSQSVVRTDLELS